MKIGPLVLKLRTAQTMFGNYIAGAAELSIALENTLLQEMAFVIQLAEDAGPNLHDTGLNQNLTERFGVIVALKNDTGDRDKTGLAAYDKLFNVRKEIFKGILDLDYGYVTGNDRINSNIYYRGGRLLGIDQAWLWYQFEFEFETKLVNFFDSVSDDTDGVDIDRETIDSFNTIYVNYMQSPDPKDRLPYKGDLPLVDGYPDVVLPDMAQWIDLTKDPRAGAYNKGFGQGFEIYKFNYKE